MLCKRFRLVKGISLSFKPQVSHANATWTMREDGASNAILEYRVGNIIRAAYPVKNQNK